MKRYLPILAVLLLFSLLPAGGQNAVSTGSIAGRVGDPSGAALSEGIVVLVSLETGLRQQVTTNAVGMYSLPATRVGSYTLIVKHDGFKTTEVRGVVVQVGRTTIADVQLEIGMVMEEVVVQATHPIFQVSESSSTTVVPKQFIEYLPQNGRRFTDLVLLTPNVASDGESGSLSIAGQQGSSASGYANGNGSNSFTVDGADATSSFYGGTLGLNRIPYLFGEQSIEEFQVAVTPYSAVYGGATGFINAVTKSGTDVLHGDAFYYLRHSATGANDAEDKASGIAKGLNVLQQFGADVGGAIVPGKLWFYFDYEQQRLKFPISVINLGYAAINGSFFVNVPENTPLPPPDSPFPVPGNFQEPPLPGDPHYSVYLQQVSNAISAIQSGLGQRPRRRDDVVLFPKIDWQLNPADHLTFSYNYNRFNAPSGAEEGSPISALGVSTLGSNFVRDHHSSIHWTHPFASGVVNDLHFSYLRDEQITTLSGFIDPSFPSVYLFPLGFFALGNAANAGVHIKEFQWEIGERLEWTHGRHDLQLGMDFSRTHVTDLSRNLFLGAYGFFSLTDFAIGRYTFFMQNGGNPLYRLDVPYYGFYIQDKFRARHNLTLDFGLREDFQVFPQPDPSPVFPPAGRYPNQYLRLAPKFGFAYQPRTNAVVRGGFGMFYQVLNGVNYVNSAESNGSSGHRVTTEAFFDPGLPADQQSLVFPNAINDFDQFVPSPNISMVHPQFRTPYVIAASLEIQLQLDQGSTLNVGTMWAHGVHLISSTAYDLNLRPPTGTTTYVVCPPGTTGAPCSGATIKQPNLDAGLLIGAEGAVDPGLGEINALISPGLNHYNSFYVQIQRRPSKGLALSSSYTFSKNIQHNGVDFWNQFDLASARGPALLDQRHRISVAAVYESSPRPGPDSAVRRLLSDWILSTIMRFNSGRPTTGLLNGTCTSSTLSFENCDGPGAVLNDSAILQSTGNSALGLGAAGPSPTAGLNSFYGPWIMGVDLGIARRIRLRNEHALKLEVQGFNIFNRANFLGINSLQYNPIGANCGDAVTANQVCYLIPNPGFGAPQSISRANGPRIFQFGIRYGF